MKKTIKMLFLFLIVLGYLNGLAEVPKALLKDEFAEINIPNIPQRFTNYNVENESFLLKIKFDEILYIYKESSFDWSSHFESVSNYHFNLWDISKETQFKIQIPNHKLPLLKVLRNGDDVVGFSNLDSNGVKFKDLQIDENFLTFTLSDDLSSNKYIRIDYFEFGSFGKISSRWNKFLPSIVREEIKIIRDYELNNSPVQKNFVDDDIYYSPFLKQALQFLNKNKNYPKVVITNDIPNVTMHITFNGEKGTIKSKESQSCMIENYNSKDIGSLKFEFEIDSECEKCIIPKKNKTIDIKRFDSDINLSTSDLFVKELQKKVVFQNEQAGVRKSVKDSSNYDNEYFVAPDKNIQIVFIKDYYEDHVYEVNSGHLGSPLDIDENKVIEKMKKSQFSPLKIKNISKNKGEVLVIFEKKEIDRIAFSENEEKEITLDKYESLKNEVDAIITVQDSANPKLIDNIYVARKKVSAEKVEEKCINMALTYVDVIARLSIKNPEEKFKQIVNIYISPNNIEKRLNSNLTKNNILSREDFREFLEIGVSKEWDTRFSTDEIDELVDIAFPLEK